MTFATRPRNCVLSPSHALLDWRETLKCNKKQAW